MKLKTETIKPTMELTVFAYYSTSTVMPSYPSRFKEIVFVKLDDEKVYIEATILGTGETTNIYMSYELLMRHRYLKPYYDLSRKAIGMPNLDVKYYGYEDPEKCKNDVKDASYIFVDTMYIVEDVATNTIEAKKGNSYRSFDLEKMKKEIVSQGVDIMEFDRIFNNKMLYDRDEYEDFDERIATYTALVDKL